MAGEELEIDRRVLETLADPLMHLLRNAIDHGIESPELRKQAGKPSAGRIDINISPLAGNKAEVVLSDDGAGGPSTGVAFRP